MSRARDARRARAQRRREIRTALAYLAAVVIGTAAGIGLDAWLHQ
jgi:hypothetical protein